MAGTDVRSFMNKAATLRASSRPTSRRLGAFLKAALTVLEGIPHEPLEISLRHFKKISIELLLQLPKQRLKAALTSNWPADSTQFGGRKLNLHRHLANAPVGRTFLPGPFHPMVRSEA
jgi:hypothetical protein